MSTCKFAQRVSLLKTDPIINEMSNSQEELVNLRIRVKELEQQLSSLAVINNSQRLLPFSTSLFTQDSKKLNSVGSGDCEELVAEYIKSDKNLFAKSDNTKTLICINLLREEVNSQKKMNEDQKAICGMLKSEIEDLKKLIVKKEKEIGILY